MLIGEGPGEQEDREGTPFVGRAGRLLEELLEYIELSREEVFITNVVKCRPPDNRDPRKSEIEACRPFLQRQIRQIRPKIICTLGNHATKTIIGMKGITNIHGKKFDKNGRTVVPLYHPAAGLYDPNKIPAMKEDFKKVVKLVESK